MNKTRVTREKAAIRIRSNVKERAIAKIDNGDFPGICSLSGLVEKALIEILNANDQQQRKTSCPIEA